MDASSPPPTGLAFRTLPIVAGLCSSDFQEWQRLCDPPPLAALSLGGRHGRLADLALVSTVAKPLHARSEQDSDGFWVRNSSNGLRDLLAGLPLYFVRAALAIVSGKALMLQCLSTFRGQVAGKQWQAGAARQS